LRSLAIGFTTSVLQDLHRCMIVAPSLATRVIASPQTGHHFVIVSISVLHFQLRERCRPYEQTHPAGPFAVVLLPQAFHHGLRALN
jgi:hypothetical protein